MMTAALVASRFLLVSLVLQSVHEFASHADLQNGRIANMLVRCSLIATLSGIIIFGIAWHVAPYSRAIGFDLALGALVFTLIGFVGVLAAIAKQI